MALTRAKFGATCTFPSSTHSAFRCSLKSPIHFEMEKLFTVFRGWDFAQIFLKFITGLRTVSAKNWTQTGGYREISVRPWLQRWFSGTPHATSVCRPKCTHLPYTHTDCTQEETNNDWLSPTRTKRKSLPEPLSPAQPRRWALSASWILCFGRSSCPSLSCEA